MMKSPEVFADDLRDYNYRELVKIRKKLTRDIEEFEHRILCYEGVSSMVDPSPDAVYSVNLEYLAEVCRLTAEKFIENVEGNTCDSGSREPNLDERKAIESEMDTISLSSGAWINMLSCGTVDVEIIDENLVILHANDFSGDLAITSRIRYNDAKNVISALHDLHTEEWIETFESEYCVLDGYSWTLRIESGEKFYLCRGDNACPEKLVEFLKLLAKYGIPLMWNDGEMVFKDRDI